MIDSLENRHCIVLRVHDSLDVFAHLFICSIFTQLLGYVLPVCANGSIYTSLQRVLVVLVTPNHAFCNAVILHEIELEFLRKYILAISGDYDVLFASGYVDIIIFVYVSEVARVEPGAVGHDLGGLLGQVVVAGHDGLAAHEDLAVLGDLDEVAGQGQADAADGVLADVLDGDRAGGLGQAVALDEGDAHAGVEVGEVGG